MPEVSERAAHLAKEIGDKFGTPSLVFRGSVMGVVEEDDGLRPNRFLGFEGTSSTFLVVDDGEGGYEVCSVKMMEKPKVMRNKLKVKGFFKVITCSQRIGKDDD
jgi:hypothetical protein